MTEQRVLCWRCANDYKEAGYNPKRDYTVKTKEPCDKCGRIGWTYFIEGITWQKSMHKAFIKAKPGEQ